MHESKTRDKVLKKIRQALLHKSREQFSEVDLESPLFSSEDESPELIFAKNFSDAGGKFIFCESNEEFSDMISGLLMERECSTIFCNEKWICNLLDGNNFLINPRDIADANAAAVIVACDAFIAESGTIIYSNAAADAPTIGNNFRLFIAAGFTSSVYETMKDALKSIRAKLTPATASINILTPPIQKNEPNGKNPESGLFLFLIFDPENE